MDNEKIEKEDTKEKEDPKLTYIIQAINTLPEKYREVLKLKYLNNYSIELIA